MPDYSYKTFPNEVQAATFRCKVLGDSAATLYVGQRRLKVKVREKSGKGFTIGIDPRMAQKIKPGSRYQLQYDDRRIDIIAETFVESVRGEARLQVGTIREHEPKERWAFRIPLIKGSRVINHDSGLASGAAYGGFVLVLFCVMSLPGIGDQLGTAPRIESALHLMGENISDVVQSFRQ
jgi:hypothetical protein